MTTQTQASAEAALDEIKTVTAMVLPEPPAAAPTLTGAEPAVAEEIRRRIAELDIRDSGSIVHFGARAQNELQEISQAMLADVKNKDVGPAGESLRNIVTTIRGFSVSELDVRRERSWWEKLLGRAAPFAKFVANYEEVQSQIDRISSDLDGHQHRLLKDIKSLDVLYDRTLNFYDELALYIAAGEEKLAQIDRDEIPAKAAAVEAAAENDKVMAAQELRDLRSARDDLEHDKSLVTKINSTLVNTVPLWETQLAQAVTIQRSAEAARAVKDANDLTNDLLTANAKNLRQANSQIRTQIERGVFDIEAVRTANAELISTIEDSLRIADEGRSRRAAAEEDLKVMETELRKSLSSASARPANPAPATAGRSATP